MTIVQEKIAQAKRLLDEFDIDCWITFVRESTINGDPVLPLIVGVPLTWHSALMIDRSGRTCAIVGRYDRKSVEETGAFDEVQDFVQGAKSLVQAYFSARRPRTIAVNYSVVSEICDGITHGMYLTLREWLTEIGMAERMVSAEQIVSALRQRKTAAELSAITKAVSIAEEIFLNAARIIRPGASEGEIADHMRSEAVRRGVELAWGADTCPSVFAGPDTAEAHYRPTDRRVQRGHVVSMDFGVRVEGYCSDLQRVHYVMADGEHQAPSSVRRGFDTIVEAIESARVAMQPGVQAMEIDRIARSLIVSRGYEEFPHALGHQVGLFAHDGTVLLGPLWEKYGSKPLRLLEEGMVFTLEPRLTVPGHGIVTVEEMVVVRATGAEFLSVPQQTLRIIPAT